MLIIISICVKDRVVYCHGRPLFSRFLSFVQTPSKIPTTSIVALCVAKKKKFVTETAQGEGRVRPVMFRGWLYAGINWNYFDFEYNTFDGHLQPCNLDNCFQWCFSNAFLRRKKTGNLPGLRRNLHDKGVSTKRDRNRQTCVYRGRYAHVSPPVLLCSVEHVEIYFD